MIVSAAAERQIDALRAHYEKLDRPEAAINLGRAIDLAVSLIDDPRMVGRPAPGPYRHLAAVGEAWVKAGRYWFCTTTRQPRILLAVFFETADIPGRFTR